MHSVSIVLPAKNEASSLHDLLPKLTSLYPDYEIIVVNDGSTDNTLEVCETNKVKVVSHPYCMGNGAAIKTGARQCTGDTIVFMDADGQHRPEDVANLLQQLEEGYDMAVGARNFRNHASTLRFTANSFFNRFASIMTGFNIRDLTSGFRAVRARHFLRFLYLLPNGFSYPTTITMAFFRSGLPVVYIPIETNKRIGKSNINVFKDGFRFLLIIVKIGALFSPMRLFLPISAVIFVTGLSYYGYTYFDNGRFTNMSALLFTTSIIIFLIGILSEQISALHYKDADQDRRRTDRSKR